MIPPEGWEWMRWYLGEGEFKGDARNPARRPRVPRKIPKAWWDRLAKILADRRRHAERPKPHDYSFWHGMSAWITRVDHFPPIYVHEYCRSDYRLLIIPTLKGTELETYPDGTALDAAEIRNFVSACRAMGYRIAGSQWGWAADIDGECDAAIAAVNRFQFDGWVMNGEKLWEGGGKSARYARRFRAAFPRLPFGWSPEPRLDLDHRVLQELGVAYMPQAYPLENGWDVTMCVEWGLKFGYAVEEIVPLVQAYTTGDRRVPAGVLRDQAERARLKGLCLYPANQATDVPRWWRELVL